VGVNHAAHIPKNKHLTHNRKALIKIRAFFIKIFHIHPISVYFAIVMNKSILAGLILLILTACHSPKEKALANIKTMEASDTIFTPKSIEDMKAAYLDFANKYPDDELAPEFIFKAAQRCNATGEHQEAITLFNSIIEKYPKHKIGEEALFLQGYIYENSLQDNAKATEVFTRFIQKYPNSELAEDAKLEIENMGKSPEEILQGITHKQDSVG
jgi:outer membrane protein assembly factor BamD (BamD/ComL family)